MALALALCSIMLKRKERYAYHFHLDLFSEGNGSRKQKKNIVTRQLEIGVIVFILDYIVYKSFECCLFFTTEQFYELTSN